MEPRDTIIDGGFQPRSVIILVKAGAPGDTIIDGGNEWYENTERCISEVSAKGLLYLGMGVSGEEDGARNWRRRLPGGRRTENRTKIGIGKKSNVTRKEDRESEGQREDSSTSRNRSFKEA
nr:6-phosphogluconate dehydrogenase, decarboxylating 2, chloroplastic-like [Ipomoea batatas]